jgi:cytochrome c biogenesis protein CcmG/thiol:disulfide interchange protein DsbE
MKKPDLFLNLFIAAIIGFCAYALTVYLDGRAQPSSAPVIIEAPVSTTADAAQATVPDFTFTDINGKSHSIRDFTGKVVILNFWASWCPPCIKEFPDLINAAAAHKDDVVLIALSSDHDEAAMERFLNTLEKETKFRRMKNVLIALDKNGAITQRKFQTMRLPETILISREGIAAHKLIGANWDIDDLKNTIEELL